MPIIGDTNAQAKVHCSGVVYPAGSTQAQPYVINSLGTAKRGVGPGAAE